MKVNEALERLPERHREALNWFVRHTGETVAWPGPLPDATILATKAKGIYKPKGWSFALSVRQTRDSPYPDKPPRSLPDGSWIYEYHQEGRDPSARNKYFTNLALLRCANSGVPVGVVRQDPLAPTEDYKVLGLAVVIRWDGGFFVLGGPSNDGTLPEGGLRGEIGALGTLAANVEGGRGSFDPNGIVDAREKIMAAIIRRRGQASFRAALLKAYGGRCAITGCDEPQALEAAHIVPYKGEETNHPANGILLRADVHTLFDLGLIAIDSSTMKVIASTELTSGFYSSLSSADVHVPVDPEKRPSKTALDLHREWSEL